MNNPIIQRELITLLRSRRAVAAQVMATLALAVVVAIRWPTEGTVSLDGSEARQVFSVFAYGLLVLMLLILPVFPATTIVRERQRGTLQLLLDSPLTAWGITLGKLTGMLGFALLLIALSLPAAAACYAMGGIDAWGQLGMGYAVFTCLAVQYVSLGLLVSSFARSTHGAARGTYGLILLLAVGTLAPQQFLQGIAALPPIVLTLADWLRCLSPVAAVMEVTGHSGIGSAGLRTQGDIAARFCLLALVTAAGLSLWTVLRMNSRLFDRARSAGRVTQEQSAAVQRYRRIMYLWFFDPNRRAEASGSQLLKALLAGVVGVAAGAAAWAWFSRFEIGDDFTANLRAMLLGVPLAFVAVLGLASALWMLASSNPVTVKEQKASRFGRGHWMIRLFGGCVILSLALVLATTRGTVAWGVETLGGIIVVLQGALVVLITPALGGGVISEERESGGWDLLRMTPMSAFGIVLGKLLSVAWTALLVLLATMPAYAVLIYIQPDIAGTVLGVLLTMGLTALLAVLLSAAVSSLSTRTATATAVSYALLVALCAGTLLVWLGRDAPFTQTTVQSVLQLNPLAVGLVLIEAPGFAEYDLLPGAWYLLGGACGLCLVVLTVQTWRLTRPT